MVDDDTRETEPSKESLEEIPEVDFSRGIRPHRCAADDVIAGERFLKVVGRRTAGPRSTATELGRPPSAEAREAMNRMANYRTRVPKGIFMYASHEEANRDWERWRLATMEANTRVPR